LEILMAARNVHGFFLARFLRGLACAFRAFGVIFSSRRLFLLTLAPFLLCLVLYVAFFAVFLFLLDDVVDLVIAPGAWWRTVVRVLLAVALPLAFVILGVFTYTLSCFVVAGPLYEWLSAGVERQVTGSVEEEPFSFRNMLTDFGRAIGLAVLILLTEVCVLIVGLLLVPVTTVLALMGSAVLLALECLDYPMGRRRMPVRERLRFAGRHAWELLGLGLPMLVGLMVPLVGAAFLPIGVVGGTLLFLQLDRREPPQPGRSGPGPTC